MKPKKKAGAQPKRAEKKTAPAKPQTAPPPSQLVDVTLINLDYLLNPNRPPPPPRPPPTILELIERAIKFAEAGGVRSKSDGSFEVSYGLNVVIPSGVPGYYEKNRKISEHVFDDLPGLERKLGALLMAAIVEGRPEFAKDVAKAIKGADKLFHRDREKGLFAEFEVFFCKNHALTNDGQPTEAATCCL